MHTLVDFITHVKGIEYLLSILFIGGFLLFWEVLKPKPFRTAIVTGKEDLEHLKRQGMSETFRQARKIIAAPFIGLMYVILLPFGFFFALAATIVNGLLKGVSMLLNLAGVSVSLEWRPMEAYFSGKKQKQAGTAQEKKTGR
jgi:hypothetical protein